MNILKYTRQEIQQLVSDGIAPVQAVRDWDIAKAKADGDKIQNIAYDNNLHRTQVHRILNKMEGRKV